ncbi:hypothetical protein B9Z55_008049 [Caenorhabditis nigoni]|uniref:Uncharacterized protein n=1 Tax=Caenorhabditis nigoni TaxID=1611254 RepID=A0A2G5VCN1_9PELO|nr:hypothetical protein B9Z55_008049 [Caenorhabditis nigoni]
MPTEEEEYIETLKKNREKCKKDAQRKRKEEVEDFEMTSRAELDSKLKPMEEKKMEEIQTIRDFGKERVDGINERKWEENQEFLRIEEETVGRERKNLESDLEEIKNQNQADLKNLKSKNLMVEMVSGTFWKI